MGPLSSFRGTTGRFNKLALLLPLLFIMSWSPPRKSSSMYLLYLSWWSEQIRWGYEHIISRMFQLYVHTISFVTSYFAQQIRPHGKCRCWRRPPLVSSFHHHDCTGTSLLKHVQRTETVVVCDGWRRWGFGHVGHASSTWYTRWSFLDIGRRCCRLGSGLSWRNGRSRVTSCLIFTLHSCHDICHSTTSADKIWMTRVNVWELEFDQIRHHLLRRSESLLQ